MNGFYDIRFDATLDPVDPAVVDAARRLWAGEESQEQEIRRKLRNKRKAWKRKYGK